MASLAVVGALPFSIRFQSLSLSSSSSSSRLSFHSRSEILGTSLSLSPSSSSSSLSQCLLPLPLSIRCGRGDRKTAKGKRFNHSFGNARPRNKKKGRGPPRVPVPPAPPKRDKFDDGQIVKIEIDESLFNG